jgi:hypothetical protein
MSLSEEEKKKTGNEIGKAYESKLILNLEVFNLATSLKLKLAPEHDGYGIFSNLSWDSNELKLKLDYIKRFMQDYAVKHFGIPVIIKDKETLNLANIDILGEMNIKYADYIKEKSELMDKMTKARRKAWAKTNRGNQRLWTIYYELGDNANELNERYKEVIKYHALTNKEN